MLLWGCFVSSHGPAVVVAGHRGNGPLLRISVHGIGSARTGTGKDDVRSGGPRDRRESVRWAAGWRSEASRSTKPSPLEVSPFASGIGRPRAGGEDLDPVPEVVVAVEAFEAIKCPAFGPVHLVP